MKKNYDLDELFSYEGWDGLYEVLHGATFDEVITLLCENGYDVCMEIEGDTEDGVIYVLGYYADNSPIIEFKNGVVARWYRQICFD